MSRIDEFLPIIQRADFEEIESARDRVTRADLGLFAETYKSLPTWEQKAALINLVQDHLDARLRPMMFDFLSAPNVRDDTHELTKAIALCHLEGDFERFMVYYNDRRLLREEVGFRLQDAPRAMEPPRVVKRIKKAAPKQQDWLVGLGFVLPLIGLLLTGIIFINQQTLDKYRASGVPVTGRVTEYRVGTNSDCIEVSYFDKSILEGGELHFADICQFLDADDYRIGQRVVVYLPEDPENNTILLDALENEYLNPAPQYTIGLLPVAAGVGLLLLRWVIAFMRRITRE